MGEDRIKLKNESRQSDYRTQGKAKKTKAVWLRIHTHDDKTQNDDPDSNQHQSVILFGKRKL